ncbi:MAG: lamin tail domain-containing protein [Phycisphaerae bacterium]|nr:lamin tail domain-containing protein [Phycisphaerae bacterium]
MRMRPSIASIVAAAGLACSVQAQEFGPVVITEIMYNPHGVDQGQEWVEIYNPSGVAIDLSAWSLEDDDGQTDEFAPGTTLGAHSLAIIVPRRGGVSGNGTARMSTYVNTQASVDAAWGPGIQVIWVESFWNYPGDANPVGGTLDGLSNSPSATNELLRLIDSQGTIIDQASYDDDEGVVTHWPDDNDSGSIQLLRDFTGNFTQNNNGAAWRLSGPGDGLGSRLANTALPAFPGLVSYGTPGQLATLVFIDCNSNGINDCVDIVNGTSADAYPYNNKPDSCEGDCNVNAVGDLTEIALDWKKDRNANALLDWCEINSAGGSGGVGGAKDTNANGILDSFENKPNIVITEILYNPAGEDDGKEFVELYNAGATPVDISGWKLRDIEGDPATGAIPSSTILQPGEVVIVMGATGPGVPVDNVAQFRAAWQIPANVRVLGVSPWQDRAQQATSIEEVLAVVDSSGEPVDVVNYENLEFTTGSIWPQDDGVSSLTLLPSTLNKSANDSGASWRRSMTKIDGAYDSLQSGFYTDARATGSTGSPGLVWTSAHQTPTGEAVISEIMYNPNSNSGDGTRNEWIEVFNAGSTTLNLTGWYLRDEDGRTGVVPNGTTLKANGTIVLLPRGTAASSSVAESDFRAAWGDICNVVAVTGWSDQEVIPNIGNLANSPNPGNEILTLRKGDGTVVDVVSFDDDGVNWPADAATAPPGLGTAWSISLKPGFYSASANDLGTNWAGSLQGIDGAFLNLTTPIFNGFDIASPGMVAGVTPPSCGGCPADFNGDGFVNGNDYDEFASAFDVADMAADFNGDGFVNGNDYDEFASAFDAGC